MFVCRASEMSGAASTRGRPEIDVDSKVYVDRGVGARLLFAESEEKEDVYAGEEGDAVTICRGELEQACVSIGDPLRNDDDEPERLVVVAIFDGGVGLHRHSSCEETVWVDG